MERSQVLPDQKGANGVLWEPTDALRGIGARYFTGTFYSKRVNKRFSNMTESNNNKKIGETQTKSNSSIGKTPRAIILHQVIFFFCVKSFIN